MIPGEDNKVEAPAATGLLKIIERLSMLCGAVSGAIIVFVLALTLVSIFMRYGLDKPMRGVDEATGFLVVAIVMFGAAETLRRGEHIQIDLVTNAMRGRTRWLLDLWAYACVLVFSAVFLFTAWRTVAFSWRFGDYSTGYLEMPMWIPQATMLPGAALLGLVAVLKIAQLLVARTGA
ncbi:TRAP transporter small permease [Mesorhizobium sp. B3-2-1]|uniref:TRAP transporter small permease subunit n=1 Tax=Mesorhizobium sp. B3-2-1 TaxID=2589891 RepID=UPI00112D481A|nr:TRAP transporter small permease [Mesorhizobium sp. B3-2-1]TPI27930.1 TRAP transporter small permease [Mesorhizobium sp. B3-2-1]